MAHFTVGQLVKHRRYGYRGVVAEMDEICRADAAWYRHNRTQPTRDQPWYHVLVHGATHTTYAAEENLEPDTSGEQIVHPLIDHFFSNFRKSAYVPNP